MAEQKDFVTHSGQEIVKEKLLSGGRFRPVLYKAVLYMKEKNSVLKNSTDLFTQGLSED